MTTEQFNAALGTVLREIRTDAGLSREELAAKLKVHLNTVSNYERGKGIPTVMFFRICMALGDKAADRMLALIEKATG